MINNVLVSTPYIPSIVVNISKKEIAEFKYSIDVGEILKHPNQAAVHSTRFLEIQDWLVSNVGDFRIGWWEGGQYGYWLLAVNKEEDIVAFKLKFKNLDPI